MDGSNSKTVDVAPYSPAGEVVDNGTDDDAATADREASPPGMDRVPGWNVVLFVMLAVLGGTADLWTKAAVFRWRGIPGEQDPWWLIEGYFGIETAVNIGAVFGLGAGKGTLFAIFSIVAAIGIGTWLFWFKAAQSRWLTCALGLITGGIIGNLYDRLGFWWQPGYPEQWQSGVRDWILVRVEGVPFFDPWPNFNIADSLLVVGAGMLMYLSFFPDKTPEIDDDNTENMATGKMDVTNE